MDLGKHLRGIKHGVSSSWSYLRDKGDRRFQIDS